MFFCDGLNLILFGRLFGRNNVDSFFFLFGCYCCCPPFFLFFFGAGQPSTHTLELCGRRVELSSTANWQWHFTTSLFVLASAVGLFPPLCTCEGRRRVVGHQSMEVLLRAACVTDYTCPCRIYIYLCTFRESRAGSPATDNMLCMYRVRYYILWYCTGAIFEIKRFTLTRESMTWMTGDRRYRKRNFAIAAVQVVQAAHFRPSVTLPGVLCYAVFVVVVVFQSPCHAIIFDRPLLPSSPAARANASGLSIFPVTDDESIYRKNKVL